MVIEVGIALLSLYSAFEILPEDSHLWEVMLSQNIHAHSNCRFFLPLSFKRPVSRTLSRSVVCKKIFLNNYVHTERHSVKHSLCLKC